MNISQLINEIMDATNVRNIYSMVNIPFSVHADFWTCDFFVCKNRLKKNVYERQTEKFFEQNRFEKR